MSSALSIQKSSQFSLKAKGKELLQLKTTHQRQRKSDVIFVKEAHIKNAASAI